MTTPALGSILLGTTNPRRLRDWYAAALAPGDGAEAFTEVTPTMFAGTFGDTSVLIDGRSDVAEKNPDPGRVILNFHVDNARATADHPHTVEPARIILNFHVADIRTAEARLVSLEAVWVRELERTRWGIIGTVLDLDGNYVQIVEPTPNSPACLQRKEEHP